MVRVMEALATRPCVSDQAPLLDSKTNTALRTIRNITATHATKHCEIAQDPPSTQPERIKHKQTEKKHPNNCPGHRNTRHCAIDPQKRVAAHICAAKRTRLVILTGNPTLSRHRRAFTVTRAIETLKMPLVSRSDSLDRPKATGVLSSLVPTTNTRLPSKIKKGAPLSTATARLASHRLSDQKGQRLRIKLRLPSLKRANQYREKTAKPEIHICFP